jgi:lipopolysaccharide export system protein LptA
MTPWQRRARVLVAVFAVAFAVVVVFAFRRQPRAVPPPQLVHLDPRAIVESTAGHVVEVKGTHENVAVDFEKQVTYKDGSSKLFNIKVTATDRRDGRVFTLTGREGQVTENPSAYNVHGDVRLAAHDGLTAATEQAAYSDANGMLHAPGAASFAKGRFAGTGVGMIYDKNKDTITILDRTVVHVGPDEKGSGAAEVTCVTATFARREKFIRFERDVKIVRGGQTTEADGAIAHLSDDEKRIERVELHGAARIAESAAAAGALQALSGRDMDLKYRGNEQVLEHALITGGAAIHVAGDPGSAGRQIAAATIDVTLGPDGETPTALVGRDAVELTFPAEQGVGARSIRANLLNARGEPGRGLTAARFTGSVDYREQTAAAERTATSNALDVALKPGMGDIEEAKFSGAVRFAEGALMARAASARYIVPTGIVELTGSEPPPGAATPHVVNEQIAVDASSINLTLAGPKMTATGSVKSILQPQKKSATKLPAMLKQDQPVNVVGDALDYDGTISKAIYTGSAQLWQGDTSIRGTRIVVDDKSGDLSASGGEGPVTTSVMLEQQNTTTKEKERVRSLGTAKEFVYEDAIRRATYTGDAHLSGPEGDMTAPRIELFLKPSGDELERAEAYENVTLHESGRRTTGTRMTYFADTERYEVSGAPVRVVDECGGETVGTTLTFDKTHDTTVLDGKKQFRTQSKGTSKCGSTH